MDNVDPILGNAIEDQVVVVNPSANAVLFIARNQRETLWRIDQALTFGTQLLHE